MKPHFTSIDQTFACEGMQGPHVPTYLACRIFDETCDAIKTVIQLHWSKSLNRYDFLYNSLALRIFMHKCLMHSYLNTHV